MQKYLGKVKADPNLREDDDSKIRRTQRWEMIFELKRKGEKWSIWKSSGRSIKRYSKWEALTQISFYRV